jgi:hypothetical protein
MFLLKQLLPAAFVAAAAAICAVAMAWAKGRAQQSLMGFVVAIGYACGHLFVAGWVSIPPTDTTNWLPIFAIAAAAVGSTLPLLPHKPVRMMVIGLIAVGALRLLLQPQFRYTWPRGVGWMWVIGFSIAVVLLVRSVDALSRRSSTRIETPLLLFIVCAGTSGALSLSGSLLLGQLAAVLGAALAGMLVLGWRGPATRESPALVFSLLLIALIVSGLFFAELPTTSVLLLGTSPALAFVPTPASGPLRVVLARISLISAPVALAVFLAYRASPSPLSHNQLSYFLSR